jgi:glycosyltransferase involved in cell wall biosynthesis
MAAGVPAVATRVGGTPKRDRRGSGLLVPPDDGDGGGSSPASRPADAAAYGRAARRVIEQRFSLRTMVAATERLYVDLLGRGLPGGTRMRRS